MVMPAKKYKYCGCVTDKSWKQAVMEQYPNRQPGSRDSEARKKLSGQYRDIPALASQSTQHEARRCQDVPLADLSQPRWRQASLNFIERLAKNG